jgi:hypothetical protein
MRLPRSLGGVARPRFLLQVGAAVALLVIVLVVRPGVSRPPRTVAVPPSVEASEPPGDTGELYLSPSVSAVETQRAVRVAERFIAAWARPDLPAATWWRGVAQYAEPGYARLLRTVEPSNVPAHRVTGPGRTVSVARGTVVADVPTDAGTCRVTVAEPVGTGTWQVSAHELVVGGPG